MNELLKINNLKKIYHTKKNEIIAIKDFSLELMNEEFIALVGPSGCGKSTILNIICGLDKDYTGEVRINNKTIGYMLQTDSLFNFRTILDNCLLGLEIKGILTEENINYVKDLLTTYGLKDFMYSYPSNLSGGMRQRVGCLH